MSIPDAIEGRTEEAVPANPGRRVLVIDDEPAMCRYMARLCNSWGISVTTSCKFQDIDFAQLAPSDIVFLDMMMPGTDGIQVLDALSRNRVKSAIVLMSGTHAEILITAETIAKRQGLRVVGRLTKPFRSSELRRILTEVPPEVQRSTRRPLSSEMNVEDLLEGLERRQFDAYLQPILDLATRLPVGYEALARWRSEKLSLVTPDRFIAVAARSGLLPRLTRQIMDRALRYAALLRARDLIWKVSVNLGAEDFIDNALPERLAEMVASHDLPSGSLTIEVTESSASTNETTMFEILARMRLKGIELAIDDFGTSYSGLERLSIIPFTSLKIDMRFIADMITNINARTIVQSAIALAKSLKIHSVAEGIETESQLRLLKELGCNYGQGYLFARPMEFESAMEWASQFSALNRPYSAD